LTLAMTTSHNEGNHIPASLVHHSMLRHYRIDLDYPS